MEDPRRRLVSRGDERGRLAGRCDPGRRGRKGATPGRHRGRPARRWPRARRPRCAGRDPGRPPRRTRISVRGADHGRGRTGPGGDPCQRAVLRRPCRRPDGESRSRWLWLVKWLLADPPLHRAGLPLGGLRRDDGDRVLRDPLHGPLPAGHLRLQRRRRCGGPGESASTHARATAPTATRRSASAGARLPGDAGDPLPGATLPRPRAREVVAARDPALPGGPVSSAAGTSAASGPRADDSAAG